jgi:DNA-binding beta-propeller fold protein YncE
MPFLLSSLLAMTLLTQPQPAASPTAKAPAAVPAQTTGPYHVIRTFDIGGEGGWDLVEIDSEAHRLYVPRSTRVMVIDTETGKVVGEVADTSGVHDVALAPQLGKGFSANGKTDDVSVFDLKTLKTEKTIKAGKNPDAIIFEPTTKRVFVFNGKSNNATVISAADLTVVGTIDVGGKPELAVVDGQGNVFVNVENTSELLRINAKAMTVEKRIALAPGEEPTGLAIDTATHRVFAACGNQKMIVVDTESGKILGTPAIGAGVDGAGFDATGHFALSSNGEGTLTVIGTTGEKPFDVVQTLSTAKGARTMTIDAKTRMIYLPTAEFEPQAAGDKGKRPKMKPGTFKVVVVGV